MSEVKIVRVHSGEELIGQVTETDTGIHIDKPAIILPAGEGRIGLAPYLPYGDAEENGVDFKDIHVVFMMNPVEEFRNQYTQSFVNGLTIPSAAESTAINAADGLKLTTD